MCESPAASERLLVARERARVRIVRFLNVYIIGIRSGMSCIEFSFIIAFVRVIDRSRSHRQSNLITSTGVIIVVEIQRSIESSNDDDYLALYFFIAAS